MNQRLQNTSIPDSIDEAAAYWKMRLSSPTCGPVDRAAFEAWRAEDAAHATAYTRVERALTAVDRHLGSDELSALGEQVLAETEPRRSPLLNAAVAGIAATVVLAAGLAMVFDVLPWRSENVEVDHMSTASYETEVGERSTVTLSDGSVVVLNTASRIKIDYSADRRGVTLTAGQALFEVARDPDRPFEVLAGDRRIVALGTAFDVRLDSVVGVQVTLLEGRVSVDAVTHAAQGAVITDESERRELSVGEQLVARNDAATVVSATDVERVTSWRDGKVIFRGDPLLEAIGEINRYSTTQLYLGDDPRLHDIRISGVFKAGRSDSFVFALETAYPVNAQQVSEDRIALLWQQEGN